uniref:Interleukin-27 subunit beta n=1 Tax=Suricata suricatta TaxID=37032 RepID=A0A673UH24_SURSU
MDEYPLLSQGVVEVRDDVGAFHSCNHSFSSQTFIRHRVGAWWGAGTKPMIGAGPSRGGFWKLTCSLSLGAPAVPTQPRVRCRASRYPVAVDCVWTLPASPHPTRPTAFIATYRLGVAARGESQPCLQLTPEATSCTVPDVQMFSMVPYILNVTAVQPQATSSTLVPFVPEHIIKPDPPEGVRLSPIPGQRLWVQWEPPRSWPFPETFSLKYWIRYKHHRSARFRQVGPIEATSFTLRAMRPRAKYCIQVAAQDLTDYGELSDWSLPATTSMIMDK